MHTTTNYSLLLFFEVKIDIFQIKRKFARKDTKFHLTPSLIAHFFFVDLRFKFRQQTRKPRKYFLGALLQMKTQEDHLSLWMITIFFFGKNIQHIFKQGLFANGFSILAYQRLNYFVENPNIGPKYS